MTEIDLTPVTRLEYDIDAILNDHAVAEPITRIELILADIVAGNTTTVEPVTRIETYLAIISGADYPVPEPVTRIETFLAIIAGEDYETPEAVTRLEGLLAEWVEKGSGIWKTVTGALIHITDALASPVKELSVAIDSATGVTGCNITHTGKNLYNPQIIIYLREDGTFTAGTGTGTAYIETGQTSSSATISDANYKKMLHLPAGHYCGSLKASLANITAGTIRTIDASTKKGTTIVNLSSDSSKNVTFEFTLSSDSVIAFKLSQSNIVYSDFVVASYGTGTSYEPYAGTVYSVSWQTEAGSITSGTLTIAEDGSVTLDPGGTTYQLQSITPISTLAGENNIWADCGDTILTYQAVPETAFSDNADTGMADYMTLTE